VKKKPSPGEEQADRGEMREEKNRMTALGMPLTEAVLLNP